MKTNWIEFIVESHNLPVASSPFLKNFSNELISESEKNIKSDEFTNTDPSIPDEGKIED